MDQRIRKLLVEAGVINNNFNPLAYEQWYLDSLEKFAQLIVRECCSKLVEIGEGWHEFARNPPDGQAHNASAALFAAYRLKEDAVDEIKQHFGVEQ